MGFIDNVKKQMNFHENGKELLLVILGVIAGIVMVAFLEDIFSRILRIFVNLLTISSIVPAFVIIVCFTVIYVANKVHLAFGAFLTVILLQILATSLAYL